MAASLLAEEPVASLVDPIPHETLSKETTLAKAIQVLSESATGELLILDEKQHLWASLDRDDLYHIVTRIAISPMDTRQDLGQRTLGDLAVGNRVYVSLEDTTLVASATMFEHGISWLPVVQSRDDLRPVGCLRLARISGHVIQKIGHLDSRARAAS